MNSLRAPHFSVTIRTEDELLLRKVVTEKVNELYIPNPLNNMNKKVIKGEDIRD